MTKTTNSGWSGLLYAIHHNIPSFSHLAYSKVALKLD
jgi:hypothetical protein